jgi:hypothetical protein
MDKKDNDNVELELSHSKEKGLSLKAKGAGIVILLCLTIGGIIFLSYSAMNAESGKSSFVILPIMFLLYLSYSLIAIMGTMFTDEVWEVRRPED